MKKVFRLATKHEVMTESSLHNAHLTALRLLMDGYASEITIIGTEIGHDEVIIVSSFHYSCESKNIIIKKLC